MAVENTNISVVYTVTSAAAGQEFPIPFPYIEKEHVIAYYAVNEVVTNLVYGTDYTVNASTLTVTGALPVGAKLVIHRVTPLTQEIVWVDGQAVYTPDIMQADDKLTFIAQEMSDVLPRCVKVSPESGDTPEGVMASLYQARDEAVESAAAAATSESNAAASENNAATSADSAASDAATAQAWAESPVAPNPQDSSSKSAKTWADMAATSESGAYGSAQSATSSAQQAAASASAAAQSASLAQSKAEEAAASELAALTSESNASTSESNAAMSESNAAESETNAAASATSAAEAADTATQAALATEIPRNPGEIFYSLLPINDPRVHLLDGSVLEYQNPTYKAFIDHVAEVYNDAPIVSNIYPVKNLVDTDGVLSGFSTYATAKIYHSFDMREDPWELKLKFTTGNDVTSTQYIIASHRIANGIKLSITTAAKLHLYAYVTGGTIDIDGTYTLSANTVYYVKIAFTGEAYTLAVSTDGTTYSTDISVSSTAGIFHSHLTSYTLGTWTVGGTDGNFSFTSPFSGSIDLSQCSFSKNGEICWTGRGHSGFTTEGDWQASVEKYTTCGKFVYNSIAKTVRLPKITGFMEGTLDPSALGSLIEAGLPNHNHGVSGVWSSGTIKPGTSTAVTLARTSTTGTTKATGAIPYGESETVQPQAIQGFIYIVLANRLKFPTDIDIENIIDTAQAWAESSTPPDPDDATSKSAKTWASEAGSIVTTESAAAVAKAQAWAESSNPPDPNDPTSKSAKEWAMVASDVVPIATTSLAGKVKPDGTTLAITQNGTLSVRPQELRMVDAILEVTDSYTITGLQTGKLCYFGLYTDSPTSEYTDPTTLGCTFRILSGTSGFLWSSDNMEVHLGAITIGSTVYHGPRFDIVIPARTSIQVKVSELSPTAMLLIYQ